MAIQLGSRARRLPENDERETETPVSSRRGCVRVIAGLALFALLAGTTWFVNRLGEDAPPEDEWKPVLTWY